MVDSQPQLLSEIQPEQLALIDQLDARQDDVLRKLDELTSRIEQLIELYLQNRDIERQNGSESNSDVDVSESDQKQAA